MSLFKAYAEEWNLNESDIEAADQLFAKDHSFPRILFKFKLWLNQSKLLLFLYSKRIYSADSFIERKAAFDNLLFPTTDSMKKALERLTTIVEIGEKTPTRLKFEPGSVFDNFFSLHPEWKEKESFVVFRGHEDLQRKSHALVERFQKSGLCYMHACVVIQHYLVAMNNNDEVPMLDMAKYLKMYMPSNSLYDHIWNNKGGDSLDFLKHILKKIPKSTNIISLSNNFLAETEMESLLKLHGPALVSGFAVVEDFTGEEWQHIGKYKAEKFEGRHAMVLVGYRVDKGKERYLLQNWWKSKPYVEVDLDYLLSSEATIHFIKERQQEMGDYPINREALVECESGIDASENFIPEGLQL